MTTSTITAPTVNTNTSTPVRHIAVVTAAAAVVAAIVTTGYGAIAIGVHGSMQAGDPGASKAVHLNAFSFGIGTLMSCALGVVAAGMVARYASNPVRRWTQIAVTLLAVSLVFPFAASHTDDSTRVVLAVAHLIAGAIVIPTVRRRLAR